jgi:hypothetical protein
MDPEHPEPRVVSVYRAQSEMAAHMLANYLQSQGVPATIGGSPMIVTALPDIAGIATVDVLVAEEDAENARRLIAERPGQDRAERRKHPESQAYRLLRWWTIALFVGCVCIGLISAVGSLVIRWLNKGP